MKELKLQNLNIVKILRNTLKTFYKNFHWVMLVILLDVVFLFVLSGVMTVVQMAALDHLTAVMKLSGEMTGGIANLYEQPDNVMKGLQGLSADEQFNYHISKLLWYLFIMVLGAYVLWVLFQGTGWWLVHRMTQKRLGYWRYMKNFALQSLLWYSLFVLLTLIWIKVFLWIETSIAKFMSTGTLNIIFWTLNLLVWYFGLFSYTIPGKYAYKNIKTTFRFCTRKVLYTGQTVLVIAVAFVLVNYFLKIPWLVQNNLLYIIIGFLIVLPMFVYVRVFLFETTNEYLLRPQHERRIMHEKHKKEHEVIEGQSQ